MATVSASSLLKRLLVRSQCLSTQASVVAVAKTFFMAIFTKWIFQIVMSYCLRD